MRLVVVERRGHTGETLDDPGGAASLKWSSVVEALDRHDIPNGLPFIVDDDGSLSGCDRLNTYLLAAWRQRSYDRATSEAFSAFRIVAAGVDRHLPQ